MRVSGQREREFELSSLIHVLPGLYSRKRETSFEPCTRKTVPSLSLHKAVSRPIYVKLFRGRLLYISVNAYATIPKGVMGRGCSRSLIEVRGVSSMMKGEMMNISFIRIQEFFFHCA